MTDISLLFWKLLEVHSCSDHLSCDIILFTPQNFSKGINP